MSAEKLSATESLLVRMRTLLDDLDDQSHPIAAAYVSQAISYVEGQDVADAPSRA